MTVASEAARERGCIGNHILSHSFFDDNRLFIPAAPAYFFHDPGLAHMHGEVAVVAGIVIEGVAGCLQRIIQVANYLGFASGVSGPVVEQLKVFALDSLGLVLFVNSDGEVITVECLVATGADEAAWKTADQW